MKKSLRRNRNSGTEKQRHSHDNRLVIPYSQALMKTFHERLESYVKVKKWIHGEEITFAVEKTRPESFHACTPDDLAVMLSLIPARDLQGLNLVVLRQPKRKEEILSPVWGRMIYWYEFEGNMTPAIILESINSLRKLRLRKKMTIQKQLDLVRLKEDGHSFCDGRRFHETSFLMNPCRNTQLFGTLPHEIGHWVDFLRWVKNPLNPEEAGLEELAYLLETGREDDPQRQEMEDEWTRLSEAYDRANDERVRQYFRRPVREAEEFANRYAGEIRSRLMDSGLIPFPRRFDGEKLIQDGLDPADFFPQERVME